MEAMGIPQEEIEAATPWLRNLLGIIRGRVYYNINNWYKGLTVLPSFGQNKEDMEEMMGLKDPVDFVEDMNLTFWEKVQKTSSPAQDALSDAQGLQRPQAHRTHLSRQL